MRFKVDGAGFVVAFDFDLGAMIFGKKITLRDLNFAQSNETSVL